MGIDQKSDKRIQITACARVATLALVALLAGCGGSDKKPVEEYEVRASTTMLPAKPPITQSQFVARVNEICSEAWLIVADSWRTALERDYPPMSERARFTKAVKGPLLAGIVFYIFDGIQNLGSPPGEEQALEEIIGPFQRAVELGQEGLWRVRSLSEVPPHFTKYNSHARRYGLSNDCLITKANLRAFDA